MRTWASVACFPLLFQVPCIECRIVHPLIIDVIRLATYCDHYIVFKCLANTHCTIHFWRMGIYNNRPALLLLLVALLGSAIRLSSAEESTTLVPAIITFGDSASDVGNNDYIITLFKANYPPYGRDFVTHQPTGRFCNGKLVTDMTADALGFTTYPAAYLSPEASGKNLLIGTNFASAAAGYDDKTAILNHAIPLSKQMQYYKEYKSKLVKVAGSQKAESIIKDALYILSAGTADFLQNYYFNPYLN